MSEITGRTSLRSAAKAVVHESYSFACMRCGLGWEQSYEIEHHTDADGQDVVMYVVDGRVVPSPLQRPRCQHCDSHVVRIMRPGRVTSAAHRLAPPAGPVEAPTTVAEQAAEQAQPKEPHHWHLSDLLHVFHRKAV
ncbi:hypothetical protein C3489_02125 [Streptomyces sp. Ru71]|uniref:hypothetical protein n=1 Tax=Streptomyces sp. Ru71 TaxID=2080746 RepID=UPI000CDD3E7E|nr:hypothetical protein [Streptomyces sp. Ru71]POX57068.1 hypothetical protein C3489_02125 [Streptomyces sp. Ru71]